MNIIPFIVLFILLFAPAPSIADPITNFIRVECNTDFNYLLIHRIELDSTSSAGVAKKPNLLKKYNLIDSSALIKYDEAENVQIPVTSTTSCKLKQKTYNIILEGYAGNANPNGMCGGWYSSFITVKQDKNILIDNISFDESCDSEKPISQIVITPDQEYMTVKTVGKEETIFNDQFPVTSEKIYKDPLKE